MATIKNPISTLIYKKLTFSFCENQGNIELRDYYYQNFNQIFKTLKTIPGDILIEPVANQLGL